MPGDATLEVQIVPAAALSTTNAILWPLNDELAHRVCTTAFLDFRGYLDDDGVPVPNTLAARIELYRWVLCHAAVNEALADLSRQAAQGEAVAASESPALASRS